LPLCLIRAAGGEAYDFGESPALNPTNFRSPFIETAISPTLCRNSGRSMQIATVRVAPGTGISLARIISDHLSYGARHPTTLGASAGRGPGSRVPSRKASRPSGFDPSRDHESLAGGTRLRARRHFIPASLSLPLCGCLVDRSRDCSRSRVPPWFPHRRYADAPAAASLPCIRFAPDDFTIHRLGREIGGRILRGVIDTDSADFVLGSIRPLARITDDP
jgi:hypothetical protein